MLGSAQQAGGAAAQPNTADQKTGLREIDGLNAEIVMIKEKVGQKEREVRCRHALKMHSLSLLWHFTLRAGSVQNLPLSSGCVCTTR
jgi:hypothetical protein